MPSNFRTYEAQSRLLAAVLASNPDIRLNFKGEERLLFAPPGHLRPASAASRPLADPSDVSQPLLSTMARMRPRLALSTASALSRSRRR